MLVESGQQLLCRRAQNICRLTVVVHLSLARCTNGYWADGRIQSCIQLWSYVTKCCQLMYHHCRLLFCFWPVNFQPLAAVEHSVAVMDSVSYPLVVVMGLANALMVVMRLDVVSYNSIQGHREGGFKGVRWTLLSHEYTCMHMTVIGIAVLESGCQPRRHVTHL